MKRTVGWRAWIEDHFLVLISSAVLAAIALSLWLPQPWRTVAVTTVVCLLGLVPLGAFLRRWYTDARPQTTTTPVLDLPATEGELYLSAEKALQVWELLAREALPRADRDDPDEREEFIAAAAQGISFYPLNALCASYVYPAQIYAAEGRLWFEIYKRDVKTVRLAKRVNGELAKLFVAPPRPGPRSRLSPFAERSAA